LTYAGKKLHEQFFEKEATPMATLEKYLKESQLMHTLSHPNIVQFFGLCLLPDHTLPLMVMEKLDCSLDVFLLKAGLPLFQRYSILEDVARGLHYLHSRPSPVIHRDLTAKNVLLTSSLAAKITDMGNSCMVKSGEIVKTLSRQPGTKVYMPPEALDDTHCYGPSLDIFSFGHLALYVITQVCSTITIQLINYNEKIVEVSWESSSSHVLQSS
jgi:serine/threonine protein kinase